MTVHLWYVNKGQNELDATNSDLLLISYSSTCFQRLCTHHQEVGLRITAYGFCPVVAVVMLESRVARCMHCAEGFASQHPLLWCWRVGWPDACTVQRVLPGNTLCTVHISCHPTLQHHNGYNSTETSVTQSDLPMMGTKTPETCWGITDYQ